MYRHLLLDFIQRFSFLQQYLIILSTSAIFLLIFRCWWFTLLLPLSTILACVATKRLSRPTQSPFRLSGHVYDLLLGKPSPAAADHHAPRSTHSYEAAIQKECDTYIRTLIARYVCVWYYPLISTDQEFPEDLMIIFHIIINRLNDRLKSLNSYDVIRSLVELEQQHMNQFLHAFDSYTKQRKCNSASKSVVEEFSQLIGFHRSIVANDTHAYLKALVELFLTDLVPESFHVYANSHTGREFLTQIVVNCIFVPLLTQFSNPRMIYSLIVLLFESDDVRDAYKANERSRSTRAAAQPAQHDQQHARRRENFADRQESTDERRVSRLERIIYSVTISSSETAYNARSGGAFTVYVMECETKSPFASNAIDRYIIRRRFREFMNLHRRLQQNHITSPHWHEIDEVFRALPLPIDNMNAEVICRRKCILEQYTQKLIANEVLNCSHDVLEFFAFNSDPNVQFEPLPQNKLPVPRVDKVLLRTLSDVGSRLNNLLPSKRELLPVRETFQLDVSTTYDNPSPAVEKLKYFIQQSSLRYSSYALALNSTDTEFLQSLLARSAIVRSHQRSANRSEIPLTDAVLKLIHTCLHSRDDVMSYQSTHQILRTIFGHFIEKFLRAEIDELLSPERVLVYLSDIRTKVLWPDGDAASTPIRNVKQRASNACMSKVPSWLQRVVGVDNVRRIVTHFLECLGYEELNRHLICNIFDLLLEQMLPHVVTEEFLTKYVQMHAGIRS